MKTISWEQWEEQFKPQINHFLPEDEAVECASFGGIAYETYGQENDYIEQMKVTDPKRVWTIMCYGNNPILSGWHYCDRLCYVITEIPADDDYKVIDYDSEFNEDGELI
jgi:hypothetical protein